MKITLNGNFKEYEYKTTVEQIISDLAPDMLDKTMGVRIGGRVKELSDFIKDDAELHLLTYSDEEGRRIYERSLRFVMLIAAKRAFPHAKVRIEHSVGEGIYTVFEDMRIYPADIMLLEGAMHDVVKEDLSFNKRRISKEEAVKYFVENGDPEKARLLAYRPYKHFNLYECGGVSEYFYGAMLPSTGKVPIFALAFHGKSSDICSKASFPRFCTTSTFKQGFYSTI